MVVRYGRQHPPDFGRSATWVETVDLAELERAVERFLSESVIAGSSRSSTSTTRATTSYRLLDVNARTWGYHALGHARASISLSLLYQHDSVETARLRRREAGPAGCAGYRSSDRAAGLAHGRITLQRLCALDDRTSAVNQCSHFGSDPLAGRGRTLPHLYVSRHGAQGARGKEAGLA